MLNVGRAPEDNAYNQIRKEAPYVMEARVLRSMLHFMQQEGAALQPTTRAKLEKTLSVALLNCMDEARAAYATGLENLTGHADPK